MSTPHRRFPSPEALLAFGLPIGLAALLVPILFLVVPRTPTTTSAAPVATAAPQQQQQIRLTVNEWRFQPKQLQLPVGKPVTLVLDNDGQLEHDVSIPALGVQLKAGAGKSASQTITASKAGTFEFLCSLPGHKEAGMQGQVTVGEDHSAMGDMDMSSMPHTDMDMTSGHASHAAVETTATRGNEPLAYTLDGDTKVFDIKAEHVRWEVLPGEFVDAYGYNGMVPGPLIRATEGDKVRIRFTNELPEPTVIHFHRPKLPNSMDGVVDVTQKMLGPGETFTYEFVAQLGGTFMYHTHHNSTEEARGCTACSSSIPVGNRGPSGHFGCSGPLAGRDQIQAADSLTMSSERRAIRVVGSDVST